jgi:hypothetical protein
VVILFFSLVILVPVLKQNRNSREKYSKKVEPVSLIVLRKMHSTCANATNRTRTNKRGIYDDHKVMSYDQEYFKNNNESKFFRNRNYFHPTKVRIVISPWNLCVNDQGKDLDILIYLWSRVDSFDIRETIRKTWANPANYPTVNVAFVLGLSNDSNVNSKVSKESKRYSDIIQGDFIDAYRNLTFKSMIQWRWTIHMCRNAKFYAKTDDDVLINTPVLLKFLNNKTQFNPPGISFSGMVLANTSVSRDPNNKFYVSTDEWRDPFFKDYTNGPFFVIFFLRKVILFQMIILTSNKF